MAAKILKKIDFTTAIVHRIDKEDPPLGAKLAINDDLDTSSVREEKFEAIKNTGLVVPRQKDADLNYSTALEKDSKVQTPVKLENESTLAELDEVTDIRGTDSIIEPQKLEFNQCETPTLGINQLELNETIQLSTEFGQDFLQLMNSW